MTREQLQQIRAIVYDAYCEGDTEAEWMLVVIDAALAAPEPRPFCYHDGVNVVDPEFANDCDVFPLYTHLMPEPAAQHARDAVAWTPDTGYVFAPDKKAAPVAAPQREWQGLTPDEINDCAGAEIYPSTWAMAFARAIESKLKEKNHG